ncbi:ROK family transcriptional regulator [Kribbella shirazensis]|uniref:Putative NBD/HSP70 family sugar kinase n=1 Tax=Kribbella shirazensis TaxID=1105143 RepID=A0A7X5VJQ2_9ACTN|nr:ROK family transcriptional regulator [Kribbella shirazensis]NIK61672.1 putative NBD/HSP70 family sugar kinase [Kribbella shirazensis]
MGSDGADQSRLRQLNERAVLAAVRSAGPVRVAQIVEQSGLGRTAVEEVLSSLVTRRWLVEESPAIRGRGRPARSYRFRAEAGYVAGLDIGAYSVRGALTDLDGRVLASVRHPVAPEMRRDERLGTADQVIAECAREAGVPVSRVWAVGAGTTGLVDTTGTVVRANAIPDWAGTNVPAHFTTRLAVADNDSQLAALAEQRHGTPAAGPADMVFLHAGRRTGLALVLDGQLRRGAFGAAADMSALRGVAWEAALQYLHDVVPADVPPLDKAERAFAAARDGDRAARAAVRRYAHAMAVAAATAIAIVDPRLLVLGGSFSRAADVLLEPLTAELTRLCPRVPEVRASELGALCVALGAASLAQDAVHTRLLDPTRGALPTLTSRSL